MNWSRQFYRVRRRLTDRMIHGFQLIEHLRQQLQVQGIGAVRLSLRRVVVHLDEYAVHARSYGGARQQAE